MFTVAFRRSVKAAVSAATKRSYSGGNPTSSDAFSKREKAAEDLYVKEHEREQLKKLRQQLEQTKKEVDELEKKVSSKN